MDLTKEYFDEQLKKAVAPLATKDDVRTEVEKGVGELAGIIANTIATPMQQHFEQLHEELAVRDRIKHLENDMRKIKLALHIN